MAIKYGKIKNIKNIEYKYSFKLKSNVQKSCITNK